MIQLRPVTFHQISPWFVDYQKKSHNYEMPPENAETIGIYRKTELIGYFILISELDVLEINQGYLKPGARHKNLSAISMKLLEELAKKGGYKRILLGTNRAVGSYIKFMEGMGFALTRAVFQKSLGE